jgi:hypothetical protein
MNGNKSRFESINRIDVPRTRKSKHYEIVEDILQQMGDLRSKKALKIPRTALRPATLAHIRAALVRGAARQKMTVATSSDDEYFYVWRQD